VQRYGQRAGGGDLPKLLPVMATVELAAGANSCVVWFASALIQPGNVGGLEYASSINAGRVSRLYPGPSREDRVPEPQAREVLLVCWTGEMGVFQQHLADEQRILCSALLQPCTAWKPRVTIAGGSHLQALSKESSTEPRWMRFAATLPLVFF
jgi:hypothetical protein